MDVWLQRCLCASMMAVVPEEQGFCAGNLWHQNVQCSDIPAMFSAQPTVTSYSTVIDQ